jgi:hypothetical protein
VDTNFNKIKKLISENNPPLPPELDWEQMEVGILDKMDKLQPSRKFSRTNQILIGIAITILLIPFFCTEGNKIFMADDPKIVQEKSPEVNSVLKEEVPSASRLTQSVKAVNINTRNNDIRPSGATEKSGSNEKVNTTNQLPSVILGQDNKTKTRSFNSNISDLISQSDNILSKKINASRQPKKGEPNLSSKLFEDLLKLPLRQVFLQKKIEKPKPAQLPKHLLEDDQKTTTKQSGRFALLGGISIWNMSYGNSKPDRDTYEKSLISYHAQFNYFLPLKKNFSLMVGLGYQQLESQFEWSNTINDYKITLSDTILQVQTNALTGNLSETRGDIVLTTTATQKIHHFNRIQLYQIPIGIAKTWVSKNWQTDILAGGSVNILSKNKGRTLYQNEIQDFNGSTTNFLSNQWKFNAFVGLRSTYKINERLGIMTGVHFQKSLSNWSTKDGIKIRPNIWSLELGLGYQL